LQANHGLADEGGCVGARRGRRFRDVCGRSRQRIGEARVLAQGRCTFAQLEKTDAVAEGATSARHLVYVFFDANCFYCHLTWKALQPYEKAGLQVRWVPVAYQQPSSVGRAAAIMQAPDRVAALHMNETRYDASQFDGGIAPLASVPKSLVAQFRANTKLMRAFGAPGTPLMAWKSEGGVRFKVGVPRLSELPAITGLPEQRVDDPELAEFR
jgi:thiol:disulfide interchange protein DsbG